MSHVEIPAYTDRWMMGDRLGSVIRYDTVKMGEHVGQRVAVVRLAISGKVVKVLASDCRYLNV